MKSTEEFKRTIQTYLERYASEDTLFARNYHKENKNIDDCITYILNYVQRSGCNGFTDEEIYGQAVHYYDEDEIEVGPPVNCRVVVNHTVELSCKREQTSLLDLPSVAESRQSQLTEEEKAEARLRAIRQYQNAELQKLQSRNKPRANKTQITEPSLFDL